MLLLRPAPSATIVAGSSSGITGYNRISGSPFPVLPDYGNLNFAPSVFSGVNLLCVYTQTSGSFAIGVSAAVAGLQNKTITLGGDTYTNGGYLSSSFGANGVLYRWTVQTVMTNGNSYAFKVE